MINVNLKLAVFGALGLVSTQVFAAGSLCALPAAPSGSAYINAYNDGRTIPPSGGPAVTALQARTNFGTTTDGGSAGLCEITSLANDGVAPVAGYGAIAVVSATRTIPSVTGGSTSIGQVVERIWRNSSTNMCILGTKVSVLSNTDHDSGTAGTQLFEINDIARGGYSSSGTVNVGYFKQAANASRLMRAGRTFTSVQHRAEKYGAGSVLWEQQRNAAGYQDLPPIAGSSTLNINGVNTPAAPGVNPPALSAGQQNAQINSNWVDFTTDSVYADDDGTTNPVSSMNYVEFPCNADSAATINATWVKTGAIRFRQTAQENTTFKEISIDGYAPPGATLP